MEGSRRHQEHDHSNRRRGHVNILFATSNPHKIEEVQAILAPHGITVGSLSDLESVPPEPVEDADTFVRPIYAGNALAHVRCVHERARVLTFRDFAASVTGGRIFLAASLLLCFSASPLLCFSAPEQLYPGDTLPGQRSLGEHSHRAQAFHG